MKRSAVLLADDHLLSPHESSPIQSGIVLRLRKSAAPFALSSLALALIVAIGSKFHLNTSVVAPLCLLVTVMHALADGLISSAVISLVAAACLDYFFVPPLFSFRIEDPLEVVAFVVFLIVANGVAWLVSKAHEALRDSRRQLALAESVAGLGLWSYDLRTKVIVPSSECLRLYGLRADSSPVTWQRWLELVHPDDRDRMERAMRQSRRQTHIWDADFRVVVPDGSVRWFLGKGTVLLDAAGKPLRLVGVNLDITENKQAEAALRESEERFRVTFLQAAVGIAQTSIDGQWLLLNPLGFVRSSAIHERNYVERRSSISLTRTTAKPLLPQSASSLRARSHHGRRRSDTSRRMASLCGPECLCRWCEMTTMRRSISSPWWRTLPRRCRPNARFNKAGKNCGL